jgi:SAM-dependent methyltransferase
MTSGNPNIDVFNRDVDIHAGYAYTSSPRLSSRWAVERSRRSVLATNCFAGRTVIDLGCGDGFYTIRYWDGGQIREMTGIDGAEKAISVADANKGDRPIRFMVGDMHHVPLPDNSFDVALLQSVLHHDDNPLGAIREAFRLAPLVVIHEPNGNNVGLKIIEKLSRYHRQHNEKSYASTRLRRWVREEGGTVLSENFAGFVPMFSPDWLAYIMRRLEPAVERVQPLNRLGCAVYVVVASRGR